VVHLVALACAVRTTTKKRSSTFWGKKVHPRENPGYSLWICSSLEKKPCGRAWKRSKCIFV